MKMVNGSFKEIERKRENLHTQIIKAMNSNGIKHETVHSLDVHFFANFWILSRRSILWFEKDYLFFISFFFHFFSPQLF